MSKQETIFFIGNNQWSVFMSNEYKSTELTASLTLSQILDFDFTNNNINAHKIGVVIYPLGIVEDKSKQSISVEI